MNRGEIKQASKPKSIGLASFLVQDLQVEFRNFFENRQHYLLNPVLIFHNAGSVTRLSHWLHLARVQIISRFHP